MAQAKEYGFWVISSMRWPNYRDYTNSIEEVYANISSVAPPFTRVGYRHLDLPRVALRTDCI